MRAQRPSATPRLPRTSAAWLLPLLLATAGACRRDGEEETGRPAVQAATALATAQAFTETVGAIGVVAVRAGHSAALGAPVPAPVLRVLVSAGEHVTAGQALVELDPTTLQAATQSAEAALSAAQQAWERADRLARDGIVSRREVEQAASDLARARADAVAARRNERLAVLRSPLAGVVTRLDAALGAMADPARPLVEVADPSALDILLAVSPSAAARVRAGAAVVLTGGEGPSGSDLGTAVVVDVAGVVDSTSGSVTVRARPRATTRPLRIGETLYGAVTLATRPGAVVVPLAALVPEGETFRVFVVDSAGIAHAREVTVGGRNDRVAEVTAGLAAGERVVTAGAYGVQDSATIIQARP